MSHSPKISLESYKPRISDSLLIDTNILIRLFYPVDFKGTIEKYEILYEKIREAKSNLLLTSIQVSEFVNRCIRIQYHLFKENIPGENIDFKNDYRCTDDYYDKMNAILDIIKYDIIPNFTFINDEFNMLPSEKLFIYGFSYDFNDAILVEIARRHNAILVTNDRDFANYDTDVKIVTDNSFLLKCK
ncbi:MAG: PIN domain-containing protein [Clostridiales bacterium]|jgi:predicted nucleic acid-binding protein|nr:PIN domain-containing protein [Clostridiales bacterium]